MNRLCSLSRWKPSNRKARRKRPKARPGDIRSRQRKSMRWYQLVVTVRFGTLASTASISRDTVSTSAMPSRVTSRPVLL